MWIVRYLSAGVRVSMHPYQWSREVCVIANYITFGMVSRPCELSAIMYEPAGVFLLSMHPYRWSREVCVIANYITFGMVSSLSAIMYEPAAVPIASRCVPGTDASVRCEGGQELISHHL